MDRALLSCLSRLIIIMQLKDRPSKALNGESSDTVYIRGFPRAETDDNILQLLSVFVSPVECDLSARPKSGEVWAKYKDVNVACKTIQRLHHASVNGSILSVKYEPGLDESGKRIVDRSSHTTIIRRVGPRKEGEEISMKKQKVALSCVSCKSKGTKSVTVHCNCTNKHTSTNKASNKSVATAPGVSYTSNSICVNEMEYPFPSGMYLTRVIELTNRLHRSFSNAISTAIATSDTINTTHLQSSDPLLAILTDTKSMGNKYAKEISEAMAMVDAVQRAISLLPPEYKAIATSAHSPITNHTNAPQVNGCKENLTRDPSIGLSLSTTATGATNQVRVYVLGDGKRPLCAAALCLHLPEHYSYYSVDPLMMPLYSCQITQSETHEQIIAPCEHFDEYQDRFFVLALMSQDFKVPAFVPNDSEGNRNTQTLSIVVSCHSHAPLQEFWERVKGPKLAITMACCADYAALYAPIGSECATKSTTAFEGDDVKVALESTGVPPALAVSKRAGKRGKGVLHQTPLIPVLEFDDFEVYSPKRAVKIYFDV